MLAKLFALILGIVGLATTTAHSPALPVPTTKTSAVIGTVEKTASTTNSANIKNTKISPGNFTQVKPKGLTSSSTPKTASTTPASKTAAKKVLPKIAVKPVVQTATVSTVAVSPQPATTTPILPPPPPVNFDAINQMARVAIVNIFCTSQTGGLFEPLSGSGVIIDPRGIILTNAHVAQFLLLQDYREKNFITCIARTGSPATPAYTLKLLYISTQWVKTNFKNLTVRVPMGTGENDFALLEIASSTDPGLMLPKSFPFLQIDDGDNDIRTGAPVVLAGYPAGFLGGIAIQRDLFIVSSIVNIGQRFTFKSDTVDVFSLGGSPVAQHGSSGGAVVNSDGKLLGVIVTSTDAANTANRDLNAISIAHINRSFATETGFTLDSLFASSLENFSSQFDTEILPGLKKLLFDELDSHNK